MAKFRELILRLIEGSPLPPRYKDHPLGGEWEHFRDCHIERAARPPIESLRVTSSAEKTA